MIPWLIAALLLSPSAHAEPLPADIFLRDSALGSAQSADRLITDVQLGKAGAENRLESWLRRRDIPQAAKLDGFLTLCGAYFRQQRFTDGIRVCSNGNKIKNGSVGNMVDLHRAFLPAGGVQWSSKGITIPLKDGQLTEVRKGSVTIEALVDTGAELGVITESVARSLGARPLGGNVEIGTTTTVVGGGMVVIDSIQVGDGQLKNLTAVVLTDGQAAYSGLKLVIPIQALVSLGRLAYVENGRRLLLGAAAPPVGRRTTRLYWEESGIGFGAKFSGGTRGVHFDSGSKRSWLFPAAIGALSMAERATRRSIKRKIGGVGGERIEDATEFSNVTISVAGSPWTFGKIEMAEKDENGEAARIGTGLFDRFSTVALDFRLMRMSVE